MAIWQTPVTDRTQEDYDFAKQKIAEWIADPTLVRYDLKGCMNISDINRIEGNIKYLSDRLNELYYRNSTSTFSSWGRESIPTTTEVSRIIQNVNSLVRAYPLRGNAPTVPTNLNSIDDVNNVEKILLIIRENIEMMVSSFKKCGTIHCSSTSVLPLRR